jgi:CRISPR system Cascade subunit CasD
MEMSEYLLFFLYAPLSSWGDIAVGERRPTFAHPTKTAVLGLVAAALGLRRVEEEKQLALFRAFGFAVRVDNQGTLLRDYHTSQVPHSNQGIHLTRTEELAASKINTVLSRRDYRCDALSTVCLWPVEENQPCGLAEVSQALIQPKLTLYLGRKSCPLAFPLKPTIVSCATLREAMEQTPLPPELAALTKTSLVEVYWEEPCHSGFDVVHTIQRRDGLNNRGYWQFQDRQEHYSTLKPDPAPTEV